MFGCPYCSKPFDGELPIRLAYQHIDECARRLREQMVTAVLDAFSRTVTPIEKEGLLAIEQRAMQSPDYREFYTSER